MRSATVEDVKEFYERYYLPGNATLVVAGDFDPAQTKALIEKYFGEIPARPVPEAPKTWNVELDAYRSVTADDVMRVYEKYVKGRNLLAVSIYP